MDTAAAITGTPAVDLIIQTAAIIAALAVILRPVIAAARMVLRARDSWEEALERLDVLEELSDNHGESVKDRVAKLREKQEAIIAAQDELVRAVTQICEWIDSHQCPPPRPRPEEA